MGMAADNKMLGQFNLEGIKSAPRGVPQIEVAFDVDANGIMDVSATDKGTGQKQKITIQSSGGLSKEEIDNMIQDAKKNADQDLKKKNLIDLKNQADSLIHNTEKSIKELKDKISEDKKKAAQMAIGQLQLAIQKDSEKDIQDKMKALSEISSQLHQQQ